MPYKPKDRPASRGPNPAASNPLPAGKDVIKGVRDLIARFGAQVEPALYALLCDKQDKTRETVDKALKGGVGSAAAVLTPLLIGKFALAPAVAAMVAAVAVQAIAAAGRDKLCEALAEGRTDLGAAQPAPEPPPKEARTKTAATSKTKPPRARKKPAKPKRAAEAKKKKGRP
jgi:hypothetical protein